MEQQRLRSVLRDAAIAGILFIVAVYHWVLFGQRKEDHASLFFGLTCAVVCVRQWIMARFPQLLGMDQTVDQFELLSKIEFLTMPVGMLTMGLFVHALLPKSAQLLEKL